MATITFNALVAVDFTTLSTTRSTLDFASPTSYDFDTATGTDIDIEGSGLSFDASNNVTAGTLTRIDIDIASDQGTTNGGDINISGLNITASGDLGSIDDGSFSLFGVALQGNDTFLLSGLNEDADTPTATNRIFGDDLANLLFFLIGGTNSNLGGNDVFSGGDNRFEVSGDVWSLDSSFISSSYTGGNDSFFSTVTEEFSRIAGDEWEIDRTGAGAMTLNGGDDTIDLGPNTSGSSFIAGDVNDMNNGVVNGGDDTLSSDSSTTPEVAGDVRTYDGGTLNGGNDVISLSNAGRAGGDVMFLNAPLPAGVFTLTGGNDDIVGGDGADIIGGDVYDRNSAVDNLIVGGDDIIIGGAGNDSLFGEVLFGDAVTGVTGGNDLILGGAGNDSISGQTGDDWCDGGAGNDTMDGGVGDDTLSYAAAGGGVVVNLINAGAQNTVGAGIDVIAGFEHLEGSRYDDTLRGDNTANEIRGGRGADLLISGAGEDVLTGGSGNDTLNTVGQVQDLAIGNSGDDTFASSGGGNILIGGAGVDTVSFETVAVASTIDLVAGQARQNGGATADVLFSIENATGGAAADRIIGTTGDNVLTGLAGNDDIVGDAGNDTLDGGTGADTLSGGSGNDLLNGGTEADELLGGQNNDTLNGGDAADSLRGDQGNDVLNGDTGADTLLGGNNNDTLNGGTQGDSLFGEAGVDRLFGGDSADTLDGGDGNDFLFGENQSDTYIGGTGADTMIFAPTAGNVVDFITDFEDIGAISDDLIDVTAYGFASVAAITATASGNDVVLDFGGNDRVRLVGYLLTNALTDVDASDFLL
jgi:Ca2+-binding RTX toxin-like protein